jgi:hypothetical protein
MQVIPQAFDMIFFPLAAYFFLEKRHLPFLISMSVVIYSHGAFGFLLLGSLILHYLKWRGGSKMIRDILLIVSPLIILTLFFLPSYLGSAIEIKNPQEAFIRENPLYFFEYVGWVPALLFFVSLVYYFFERKRLGEIDTLAIFWFMILIPMLLIYPERFATYAIVPMCIMISKFFTKISAYNKPFGLILLLILFILALPSYFGWWYILGGSGLVKFDIH